jgi:hypothetical protein
MMTTDINIWDRLMIEHIGLKFMEELTTVNEINMFKYFGLLPKHTIDHADSTIYFNRNTGTVTAAFLTTSDRFLNMDDLSEIYRDFLITETRNLKINNIINE